ncbi:MAG TPA: fructokinase [Chloroflexi bacterium]|nr:fructokinase [Chloroflexota bacterium]
MPEVIALGELLIDFVSTVSGVPLSEAPAFEKAPGGAPANVAAGLAKLGKSAGFMGKVGDDAFGHFLAQTLRDAGVDTAALRFSAEARTALAFVSLRADGEREFMFYRHPSADMLYTPAEVDEAYIRDGRIFHYGSISLIDDPVRGATLHAVETAREAGLLISYDPNLRLNLWASAQAAREGIMRGWPLAQVIKVSEEELAFLAGTDDFDEAVEQLWHPDLRLLIVTLGKAGCRYATADFAGQVGGFPVRAVDTTGAGDGFVAGLLKGLLEYAPVDMISIFDDGPSEAHLRTLCRYANAVGALTTTRRGAIPALPAARQVDQFIHSLVDNGSI